MLATNGSGVVRRCGSTGLVGGPAALCGVLYSSVTVANWHDDTTLRFFRFGWRPDIRKLRILPSPIKMAGFIDGQPETHAHADADDGAEESRDRRAGDDRGDLVTEHEC